MTDEKFIAPLQAGDETEAQIQACDTDSLVARAGSFLSGPPQPQDSQYRSRLRVHARSLAIIAERAEKEIGMFRDDTGHPYPYKILASDGDEIFANSWDEAFQSAADYIYSGAENENQLVDVIIEAAPGQLTTPRGVGRRKVTIAISTNEQEAKR